MSLLDLVGAHQKVLRPSGGCHNCPRKRIDFVPATLNSGPVLVLGETPGETEVEKQEGFVGASGTLLRECAQAANVPGPWSFSYTLHCRLPAETVPKPKEISCCLSQFVLKEIEGYSVVVLCGNAPLQAIFPGAKADHFRGNVARHPDFPGVKFFVTYSPSYIVRRRDLRPEFERHMARLARIVQGEPDADWKIARGAQALAAMREMVKKPLLSLDLETNRLESWVRGGHIKTMQCTADGKTVVAVYRDDPQFATIMQLLMEFLEKEEKSVIGAHIGFDLDWIEREYGIRVACQLIHDVAVQWYHAGQYKQPSLKELVSRELDGYRWLVHEPHLMKDEELLLNYGTEDVVYPLRLWKRALQILKPRTRDLCARVVGPADWIMQRVSSNGLYVRQDYLAAKQQEYADRRRAAVNAWKAEDPEFVPDTHESGDGLLRYLFEVRKLPVLDKTDGGAPSTDKSVVKQWVRDGHTYLRHLLEIKEIDKIESTYMTGYKKLMWPDSRLRSHYPLTFTDSGRTSSRSPNLQNVPRKKEIRDIFGAPPGSLLLESDLSQIEFRIMVCLAGDENGIAGYMRGEDAHTITARSIAGVDKPTKAQRSNAKPVNFGFLYGAHWGTVQQIAMDDYGVMWTDSQSESFQTAFMTTYPRIPVFHGASRSKLIANRGWFESVVGHVFHYKHWDANDKGQRDHEFRAALNAEAQGPAAHICFYIMAVAARMLDKRGFRNVMYVNHVHDSIMTELENPKESHDVAGIINEAAAVVHEWVKSWFVVPLIMEHSIGEAWGSLEEIKL